MGVKSSSGAGINYPAQYDSVAFCTLGYVRFGGGKYSMLSNCTINGQLHFAANGGLACYDHGVFDPNCVAPAEQDTVRRLIASRRVPGDR